MFARRLLQRDIHNNTLVLQVRCNIIIIYARYRRFKNNRARRHRESTLIVVSTESAGFDK